MKRDLHLAFWMGAAFIVSLGLACPVLAIKGINPGSLEAVLRLTARWAFALFWMAYTGRAIATLFGPSVGRLVNYGREFGLAFAASMLVHLGAVAGLFLLTWRAPFARWLVLFFLSAAFWVYLLALFSFSRLAKALGAKRWRVMRIVGMNYILCAFMLDFVTGAIHSTYPLQVGRLAEYAPFAGMSVGAPLLVLAAAIYGGLERRYSHGRLRTAMN
jgi:hypothetical protein